jgi:hypothetical protein
MVRYALRLPVIFRWGEGMTYVEGGFTKEIGGDEAFVLSATCPPIGSQVSLQVLVPSPDLLPGTLRLECTGKVTDVVRENGYSGFILHGRFHECQIRDDFSVALSEALKRTSATDSEKVFEQ